MSNLGQRILTGLLAGGASVIAIWFFSWGLLAFCFGVSLLSVWEFSSISLTKKSNGQYAVIFASILLWLGLFFLETKEPNDSSTSKLLMVVFLLPILFSLIFYPIALLFSKTERQPLVSIAFSLFGFLYTHLPLALLFLGSTYFFFENEEYNPRFALGILFLNWMLDTMAYFGGKFFGRHLLFKRISPKKTWEGAFSGAVFCLALGLLLDQLWPMPFQWWVVALIISIFSQFGDLVESMFKRNFEIKDSGSLLPGHGGLLDRFDGLFFSTPLIFLYLLFSW